jgi:iron complex outermembrane receptor protein
MREGRQPRVGRCVFAAVAIGMIMPASGFNVARAAGANALPGIVVVGQRRLSGTPASVDRVRADAIPARPQRSVSEWLQQVPGVAAHDRQNLAQDVQLTIRGFGARSTFGVRGLQLFVDGIPATMPDGQGQVSHVPLQALARVDVLRGPFSALYGNASGGVIEFFSADPPLHVDAGLHLATGGDGLLERDAWLAGPWAGSREGGYRLDAGRTNLDGYRMHSRAQRDVDQIRVVARSALDTRIEFTANAFNLRAEDPQGLRLAQALQSPRAASAGALAFDTRKRARQQQLGLRLEQPLGARNTLSLSAWGGTRDTFQMLSVPVAAQAAPGSAGGVVDLSRRYSGADLRWRGDTSLAGHAASLTLGALSQRSDEHRLGYENFVGQQLGVIGALRRNQRDAVASHDVYVEASVTVNPRWKATLGARNSRVDFRSRDAYITTGNPDDSGSLDYRQTTPAIGLLYQPLPDLELYANAGRGFETPSLTELGYRSDGGSGLNATLRPARSDNGELGLRLHRGNHQLEVVAFDSRTHDELVVASNLGGRSTYANAATSTRSGWELSASGPLGARVTYAVAFSRLHARYDNDFSTCRAPPCTQPDTLVSAGSRIPATAPEALWAQLRWTPVQDLDWFVQTNAIGRVYADDANTAYAHGYATLDTGIERHWRIAGLSLVGFARIDNLLDRHAIGSVIVNDSNGRYFEPAPGRSCLLGVSLHGSPSSR